jgi:hypothetical protein
MAQIIGQADEGRMGAPTACRVTENYEYIVGMPGDDVLC